MRAGFGGAREDRGKFYLPPLSNTHYQNPLEAVAHSRGAGNIEGHSYPQKFWTGKWPWTTGLYLATILCCHFPFVTKLPCLMLNSLVTNPNPNLSSFLFLHPALPPPPKYIYIYYLAASLKGHQELRREYLRMLLQITLITKLCTYLSGKPGCGVRMGWMWKKTRCDGFSKFTRKKGPGMLVL